MQFPFIICLLNYRNISISIILHNLVIMVIVDFLF